MANRNVNASCRTWSHGGAAFDCRSLNTATSATGVEYACTPALTVVAPGTLSTIAEKTSHDANVATCAEVRCSFSRTNCRTDGNGLRMGSLLLISVSCA